MQARKHRHTRRADSTLNAVRSRLERDPRAGAGEPVVTGWYGQSLVFSRPGLSLVPDYDTDLEFQIARRDEMAAAHPEVDWLGRRYDLHTAYVNLPRGGYLVGADTLRDLLDKLADFFEPTEGDDPDTG